jgi:hypothetical protein
VEKPTTALQASREQTMSDNAQAFGFSSATASVQAYQAQLQEITQANMQFGFEFVQRLAKIRSPFEIPGLLAELTTKQLAMFQNLLASTLQKKAWLKKECRSGGRAETVISVLKWRKTRRREPLGSQHRRPWKAVQVVSQGNDQRNLAPPENLPGSHCWCLPLLQMIPW